MSDLPLVSVIVPAYNCERYVAAALQSALDQDYPNKEIIVVDDGSTDGTSQILRAFGSQITVIRQRNAGAAAARNTAINRARGKYLALLDSDDLWLPHKLSSQITYLEAHPEVGMVYSAWREWYADATGDFKLPVSIAATVDTGIDEANSGWLYNRLLLDSIIHTTTAIIRAAIAEQVGAFDTNLRRGQDYDYWLRVSRVAPIHKLCAVLSLYRIHDESITRRAHSVNYGYVVVKKALDRWGVVGPDGTKTPRSVVKKTLAGLWFDHGYTHYHAGDLGVASDAFRRCICYRPMWYAGWLYWVRSELRLLTIGTGSERS